jgi:hypothetical protein
MRNVRVETRSVSRGDGPVLDLGNYDVVAALRERGCALCRVLSEAEVRAMDAFIDEGGQLAEARSTFVAALEEPQIQRVYRESDGLCVQHLEFVGAEALPSHTPQWLPF